MSAPGDYGSHDALGLAELVRTKQVSARELVDECIARVDRVNGQLNAVVTRMDAEARAAAAGPLEGPLQASPSS